MVSSALFFTEIRHIVILSLAVTGGQGASISRPVRNDSEVGRALEWTARNDYFYSPESGSSVSKQGAVDYHLREAHPSVEASAARSDVSSLPPHPLGRGNPECPLELELLWSTRLGSSIYSAPVARRSMFSNGGVQLVVPTFVRYLELIEGDEGLAPFGWPLAFDVEDLQKGADGRDEKKERGEFTLDDEFRPGGDDFYGNGDRGVDSGGDAGGPKSQSQLGPALFHGSAAVHDVNGDGIDDVCVVDGDGNVYWVAVGEYGQYLHDYRISVPRLKVRKNWYEGLDADFLDSYIELSMFHHEGSDGQAATDGVDGSYYATARERIGEDLYGGGVDDVAVAMNGGKRHRRAKEADTLAAHASSARGGRNPSKPWSSEGFADANSMPSARGHSRDGAEGTARRRILGLEQTVRDPKRHPYDYRGMFSDYASALQRVQGGAQLLMGNETNMRENARRGSLSRGGRRRLLEEEEEEEEEEEDLSSRPDFGDGGGGEAPGEEEEGGEGMPFGDDDMPMNPYSADELNYYEDDLVMNTPSRRNYGNHLPGGVNESDYVLVDAHVLSTPTVADINGDGHVEILLSVSYFFDRRKYSEPGAPPPAPGVDPSKYVAGGVVCYDLQLQDWAWSVHLDLTTDEQRWRAYVFGAPTVADLDGDGDSEVIVGTSLGLLYVLDATSGFALRGFPMQFGEIQSQIAVADLVTADASGDLEMIFADMNGNLVCVDRSGNVLWDRQLAGGSSATPTIGDVDNDGHLDVAVTVNTVNGAAILYVVCGETGEDLNEHFPMRVASQGTQVGALAPPVLLVDLHERSAGLSDPPLARKKTTKETEKTTTKTTQEKQKEEEKKKGFGGSAREQRSEREERTLRGKSSDGPSPGGGRGAGLHLVLPTYDGKLHAIEGATGCANYVDIGEHVYAMPLADDLQGDGMMDLVVGTMNGELMSFGTSVPYHPLNAWTSMPNGDGRNGFTHGRSLGVFVYESTTGGSGSDILGFLEGSGNRGGSGSGSVSSSHGLRVASNDIREIVGRYVTVTFEIVDRRYMDPDAAKAYKEAGKEKSGEEGEDVQDSGDSLESGLGDVPRRRRGERRYAVSLTLGSNALDPLVTEVYDAPGVYTLEFDLPRPMLTTIVLNVVNEHGQSSTARFSVSYNRHFYETLKWVATLPLLLAVVPLLLTGDKRGRQRSELPS